MIQNSACNVKRAWEVQKGGLPGTVANAWTEPNAPAAAVVVVDPNTHTLLIL